MNIFYAFINLAIGTTFLMFLGFYKIYSITVADSIFGILAFAMVVFSGLYLLYKFMFTNKK